MGDIYRKACEVIAWLGTPDWAEPLDGALDLKFEPPGIINVPEFEFVTSATSVFASLAEEENDSTEKVKAKTRELANFCLQRADDFERISELCKFEYWGRLWIIQELCLARRVTILYGRKSLYWSALSASNKALEPSISDQSYHYLHSSRPGDLRLSRYWTVSHGMYCDF